MKKLVEFLARSIVENPKDVLVEEKEEEGILNLRLRVNPEDLKIVIGRQGKTIKAIRHLLKIKASKQSKGFQLNLEE